MRGKETYIAASTSSYPNAQDRRTLLYSDSALSIFCPVDTRRKTSNTCQVALVPWRFLQTRNLYWLIQGIRLRWLCTVQYVRHHPSHSYLATATVERYARGGKCIRGKFFLFAV